MSSPVFALSGRNKKGHPGLRPECPLRPNLVGGDVK